MMLIERDRSALLVIDLQERLAVAMEGRDEAIANAAVLVQAARRLGVPVLASEQYPRGLGPTVPELKPLIPEGAVVAKTAFSCCDEPAWREQLEAAARPQAILAGIEAHVCVLQTALGLKALGLEVAVVADATASRKSASKEAALDRLRAHGVEVVTTEMVVFEWLKMAGTPEFKELSRLIR